MEIPLLAAPIIDVRYNRLAYLKNYLAKQSENIPFYLTSPDEMLNWGFQEDKGEGL